MKEIITWFLLVFLVLSITMMDVTAQQKKYTLFESKQGRFSFRCPRTWKFEADTVKTDSSGEVVDWRNGRFVSTDSTEAKVYKDCYDGIIFYLEIVDNSLDHTLLPDSLYVKKGTTYYSTFSYMSNSLKETENIKGKNWTGIHHINSCRIFCKEDDISPLVEGCEFLYFSDGKRTVSFSTSGRPFDDDVLVEILLSFRFTK